MNNIRRFNNHLPLACSLIAPSLCEIVQFGVTEWVPSLTHGLQGGEGAGQLQGGEGARQVQLLLLLQVQLVQGALSEWLDVPGPLELFHEAACGCEGGHQFFALKTERCREQQRGEGCGTHIDRHLAVMVSVHSPLLCIAEAYLAVDVVLPHMQPGLKRDADEQKPCDRPAVRQQWGHVAAAALNQKCGGSSGAAAPKHGTLYACFACTGIHATGAATRGGKHAMRCALCRLPMCHL